MQRIGVAIIHGIEIADPDFAETPRKLLYDGFMEAAGSDAPSDPTEALVIKPIHWAPALDHRQRALFAKVYDESEDSAAYFDERIRPAIKHLNAGKQLRLLRFLPSLVDRHRRDLDQLNWPALRWLMMHLIGDVIAYDDPHTGDNYRKIHAMFAELLSQLADEAGDDAPLCVIAHSLGSVVASDYFYDQRTQRIWTEVEEARGDSPLARGHTLAWLYTMGSPLALWSLKYPGEQEDPPPDELSMSKPIEVPARQLEERYPDLPTEWVNIYDKDDVIAFPLAVLSDAYSRVVEDREVKVRTFPFSPTPLTHSFYWADRGVMDPIARKLADGWRHINDLEPRP